MIIFLLDPFGITYFSRASCFTSREFHLKGSMLCQNGFQKGWFLGSMLCHRESVKDQSKSISLIRLNFPSLHAVLRYVWSGKSVKHHQQIANESNINIQSNLNHSLAMVASNTWFQKNISKHLKKLEEISQSLWSLLKTPNISQTKTANKHIKTHPYKKAQWFSSWWFQPIWKILIKLDHFPR